MTQFKPQVEGVSVFKLENLLNHAASHFYYLHKGFLFFVFCIHRCMGATPRSWVPMPRRRQPAYEMEGCGMAVDCGGTPAFEVVLQICWSMIKVPVQSASVSDNHSRSTTHSSDCAARDKVCKQCNAQACPEGRTSALVHECV